MTDTELKLIASAAIIGKAISRKWDTILQRPVVFQWYYSLEQKRDFPLYSS